MLNISFLFTSANKIGLKDNTKINLLEFLYDDIKYYKKDVYIAIAFNSILENPCLLNSYFSYFNEDEKLKSIKKKKIFIICSGGSEFKKWDIYNYIKLCQRLGKDFYYVFILGDMEKKYFQSVKNFLNYYAGEIGYNLSFKNILKLPILSYRMIAAILI